MSRAKNKKVKRVSDDVVRKSMAPKKHPIVGWNRWDWGILITSITVTGILLGILYLKIL